MQKRKSKVKNQLQYVTLSAVADELEIDVGQLHRESDRPGFPVRLQAGKRLFNVAEVREWRCRNIIPRKQRSECGPQVDQPPQAAVVAVAGRAVDYAADPFARLLSSGNASAIDISRAVVQRIAQQLSRESFLNASSVDAMKKSLQELRQAESDYIDLAERQGKLIAVDTVRMIIGKVCTRLVRCCERLEISIGTELALWLADPAVRDMPADQRVKKVREWVAKTCNELRTAEADAVLRDGIREAKEG